MYCTDKLKVNCKPWKTIVPFSFPLKGQWRVRDKPWKSHDENHHCWDRFTPGSDHWETTIVVEGTKCLVQWDIPRCCALLMEIIYALNLSYCKKLKYTCFSKVVSWPRWAEWQCLSHGSEKHYFLKNLSQKTDRSHFLQMTWFLKRQQKRMFLCQVS